MAVFLCQYEANYISIYIFTRFVCNECFIIILLDYNTDESVWQDQQISLILPANQFVNTKAFLLLDIWNIIDNCRNDNWLSAITD